MFLKRWIILMPYKPLIKRKNTIHRQIYDMPEKGSFKHNEQSSGIVIDVTDLIYSFNKNLSPKISLTIENDRPHQIGKKIGCLMSSVRKGELFTLQKLIILSKFDEMSLKTNSQIRPADVIDGLFRKQIVLQGKKLNFQSLTQSNLKPTGAAKENSTIGTIAGTETISPFRRFLLLLFLSVIIPVQQLSTGLYLTKHGAVGHLFRISEVKW